MDSSNRKDTNMNNDMHYNYILAGSGLYSAVIAYLARQAGKTCLVLEKRDHIGGNIYCEEIEGIHVHKYGAHIFHTSNRRVWDFVNSLAEFNRFTNSPIANYKGEIYNMPFNMNTFSKMWGIRTPAEAQKIIAGQIASLNIGEPRNLEEQALSLAGKDVYEKLIKGYTQKQWGRDCRELPAFIIKRVPLRFRYDNNYFNDPYQGIPKGGYTAIAAKMLEGTEVRTGISYREFLRDNREKQSPDTWDKVLYTGMIDEYFDFRLGALEYRSLRFETEELPDEDNFQGNAVVNYTDEAVPYTRIIEHKHFEFGTQHGTVITKEYPAEWKPGDEPYYPVNDDKNMALYAGYRELAQQEKNVLFGGRLGQYRYYDMDKVLRAALDMVAEEL